MAQTLIGCLLLTFLAFFLESIAYALPGWKYFDERNFEGIFLNCPKAWQSCEKKFTIKTLSEIFNTHTRDGTCKLTCFSSKKPKKKRKRRWVKIVNNIMLNV